MPPLKAKSSGDRVTRTCRRCSDGVLWKARSNRCQITVFKKRIKMTKWVLSCSKRLQGLHWVRTRSNVFNKRRKSCKLFICYFCTIFKFMIFFPIPSLVFISTKMFLLCCKQLLFANGVPNQTKIIKFVSPPDVPLDGFLGWLWASYYDLVPRRRQSLYMLGLFWLEELLNSDLWYLIIFLSYWNRLGY